VQDLVQEHPLRAAERQLASQQLVQHHPQAVHVGPAVHLVRVAAGLLRAHVRRGAQHLALDGHRDLAGVALGQAEVHHARPAVAADHDVRGLHVAVDDAALVRVLQGVGNGHDQLGRLAERQLPRREQVRQRHPLDEVAHQVRQAVGLADLVDGHHRGVPELCHAAGLAQEAVEVGRPGEVAGPRHLDGDGAVQLRVERLVDGAERPAADGGD
jgi:hypothetical protein